MRINTQSHGAVTVIKPQGPLNQEDADALKESLAEVSSKSMGRFIIDMTAIPFVDSRGLEVLVEASEQLERSGQTLKLCGTNETIREVFGVTELDRLFEHYDDTTTAVRSFL